MDLGSELNTSNVCSGFPFLNLTVEENAAIYILNEGIGRTMLTVLFTILAVGVPGNLAFLFVVVRVPYMRTTTNVYLASLAVADLTFLLSSIVEYYFYFTHPVRSHLPTASFVGCVGAFMPQYVTYFASVSMVTLVSLERYKSICKPLLKAKKGQRARMRESFKLVAGSWIVAIGLASLAMMKYARLQKSCAIWPDAEPYESLPTQLGFCMAVGSWGLIVGHLFESVVFIMAMVANIAMYTLIIISLQSRVKQKRTQNSVAPSVHAQLALQIRNQVALMLVINGVVFFLCQASYIAISLGFLVENIAGIPGIVTYRKFVFALTVSHVFVFLNSAVNPIIYNVTSRHYRQAFVDAFSCSRAQCGCKVKAKYTSALPSLNNKNDNNNNNNNNNNIAVTYTMPVNNAETEAQFGT